MKDYQKNGCTSGCISGDMNCNQDSFASRLIFLREKAGMTQGKLAQKTGLSKTTIQNYEGGKIPKGDNLIALSQALGCSVDWLLTGKGFESNLEQAVADQSPKKTREAQTQSDQDINMLHDFAAWTCKSQNNKSTDEKPQKDKANHEHSEYMEKTSTVLRSETVYSEALKSNIDAFYQSVILEDQLDEMQKRQENFQDNLEHILGMLQEIRQENQAIREENSQLRRQLQDPDDDESGSKAANSD